MAEPRVLLISGEYPPMQGGVADYTRLLGEALAAQGAEVHVLTSSAAGATAGAVCCHPWLGRWGWGALGAALRHAQRELAPQVLHIQYQTAAYGLHPAINLLPSLWRGLPWVVTFHDLKVPYLFPKAGALRWRVNAALARAARAVIATNAEDRAQLASLRGLGRLETIPIGSNIAPQLPAEYDRVAWRARWGVAPDALLLTYFGFLNASKGGEELILALDRLVRSGYNAELAMIGGHVGASDPTNREYLARVQALIRERALEERVRWTGYLDPDQVSAALVSADACVLPYRDGASFRRGSLMAALAHGCAIVTTRPAVPLPELVDGANVLLAPASDPDGLAAAITRLASDPTLRQRLSAGARALAATFDWQRIAARTLEVYRDVASP